MIEPLGGHVRSVLGRLGSLGFRVVSEGTHHVVLDKGDFRLMISCERYRPDSVAMTLMHATDDVDVGAMHVVDIMKAIAPRDLEQLWAFDFKSSEGVRKALVEQVEFLVRNEDAIFVRPAIYRTSYEKNNRPDWAPSRDE